MKVRFWGCRGSIPRSRPDMLRYGGNTPCIEVTSYSGQIVVLDLGSGAFDLGVDLMKRAKESDGDGKMNGTVLITHTHWDHIQGFPFFAPLFNPGFTWNVYGPRGLAGSFEDTLSGQMKHDYFPVTIKQLGARVTYHDLVEGSFQFEGVRVKTHYLNHTVLTLGYKLESGGISIAYITDHEPFDHRLAVEGYERNDDGSAKSEDDRHVDFFAGVHLLIHDCQYTAREYGQGKTGWGHSTVEYVVDVALAASVKQLALFHHDPNRTDDQVDEIVRYAKERAAQLATQKGLLEVPEIWAAAEGTDVSFGEKANFVRKNSVEVGMHPSEDLLAKQLAQRKDVNIEGKIVLLGLDYNTRFASDLQEDLQKDKLTVRVCENVDSILEACSQSKPSLVVLKQAISGGNAVDICFKIRGMGEWGKETTFLVVAKNQDDMEMGRAESDVIPKESWLVEPVSISYIRTRIRMSLLRAPCKWVRASIPANEEARLTALKESCMMDVNQPDGLKRITRVARQLFDVGAACFTLLAKDYVKLISAEGLDCINIPRDEAMCAHVVSDQDFTLVADALKDDRFADSPLVQGAPYLRFYAGMPIWSKAKDGQSYIIGSFCLMDQKPREFDTKQLRTLQDLASLAREEFGAISAEAQKASCLGVGS
ncbi:hypothetical protein ACHAXS_013955 [Conticribra weissflogii]